MSTNRRMWTIWKDEVIRKWRMVTPVGVLTYDRRSDALYARNRYLEHVEEVGYARIA